MANLSNPPEAKLPASDVSDALRIVAVLLRTLFIFILLVLTLRVSMPQNETIWTAYDTPADLIRLILGLAVCIWLATQLFTAAQRTPTAIALGSISALPRCRLR